MLGITVVVVHKVIGGSTALDALVHLFHTRIHLPKWSNFTVCNRWDPNTAPIVVRKESLSNQRGGVLVGLSHVVRVDRTAYNTPRASCATGVSLLRRGSFDSKP